MRKSKLKMVEKINEGGLWSAFDVGKKSTLDSMAKTASTIENDFNKEREDREKESKFINRGMAAQVKWSLPFLDFQFGSVRKLLIHKS